MHTATCSDPMGPSSDWLIEHIKRSIHIALWSKISLSWFQTFVMLWMLYTFFWVIPWRLNFIRRRFGTLSRLHRQVGTYLPMKMGQSVPKRRHIKFRLRGITKKKAYKISLITNIFAMGYIILELKFSLLWNCKCICKKWDLTSTKRYVHFFE